MKAVILTAGMGKRLGLKLPKALVEIEKGKTILDFQLNSLKDLIGMQDVLVVVGFKKNKIIKKYPSLSFVNNGKYRHTQTSASLKLALEKINEDVIWMNGDVFFEKGAILKLLACNKSACLVNKKRCSHEEIKYSLDSKGYIRGLSKQIKNLVKGEALGIFYLVKNDLEKLKKELIGVNEKEYFEKGVEAIISKGVKIAPIDVGNLYCREIDYKSDLIHVKHFVANSLNRTIKQRCQKSSLSSK